MKWKTVIPIVVIAACFVRNAGAGTVPIKASEYGSKWPFTVSEGILERTSIGNRNFVTFTADGKTYAVNGTSRNVAEQKGWIDFTVIWKDNPNGDGKVDITPILNRALELPE
jgi:hypothetical protein